MTFPPNMPVSARRHLYAAEALDNGHRRDVAGYLYGIAAECAIKAMMLEANLRPTGDRRNDPFYLHFPQLRTALLDNMAGRRATPLMNFIGSNSFLSHWATDMRYCKGDEILGKWVDLWSAQARQAVSSIGT